MNFLPSSEQQQIIDSIKGFFAGEFSLDRLRDCQAASADCQPGNWLSLAQMGLFGMSLDESQGGSGYTVAEELLLHREAGRVLLTPNLLAQSLATRLAVATGMDPAALIDGTQRAALLAPIAGAKVGNVMTGDFHLFDACDAHWLVVWDEDGAALVESASVAGQTIGCLDESLQLQRASLIEMPAATYIASPEFSALATLLLAAQLVGIAEVARDMAVDYGQMREQFGQAIGAFQAVKHLCADMAVGCEAAWAQSVFAALTSVETGLAPSQQIAAALVIAAGVAERSAAANVQIHGGMGYTHECHAHRLVKRAKILERLAGGIRPHRLALLPVPLQPQESVE
jgi:alkylation response protein AidB-like acyl-CoA dehydrogenase